MRRGVTVVVVSGILSGFAACVGDDPAVSPGAASPDGSLGTSSSGGSGTSGESSSSGGTSGSSGSSGEPLVDGGGQDAEVACGYPGEPCCVAPVRLCRAGTICSTADNTCVVNDLIAVGETGLFAKDIITSRWDGSSWTPAAIVAESRNFSPEDLWVEEGAARIVSFDDNMGKMYTLTGTASDPRWGRCQPGHSCTAPNTIPALWSVIHVGSDWWLGASNAIYRCTGSTCATQHTGLESESWGTGMLVGSSPQDLWYGAYNRAFQFDGTRWTIHPGVKARSLHQVRKNDLWAADTRFQHWNGTVWSDEVSLANGEATPGLVMSMSGAASDDIWAGGNENDTPFLVHWDGVAWTLVSFPVDAGRFGRIWAPSRKEAFATAGGSLWRWNGTVWAKMTPPAAATTLPDDSGTPLDSWLLVGGAARPRP